MSFRSEVALSGHPRYIRGVVHCPQCGKSVPDGAIACPYCGQRFPDENLMTSGTGRARTIVGGTPDVVGSAAATAVESASGNARTLVGMPNHDLQAAIDAAKAANAESRAARTMVGLPTPGVYGQASRREDSASGSNPARTQVGGTSPMLAHARGVGAPPRGELAGLSTLVAGTPADQAQSMGRGGENEPAHTLLGVARPGIAPLSPGVDDRADWRSVEREARYDVAPSSELGATIGPTPQGLRPAARDLRVELGRHKIHRRGVAPRRPPPRSNRALILGAAAGGFAVAALIVAFFWTSAPPLTARPKSDAQGKEALEITCASCPDGTTVTINGVTATVTDHLALVSLPAELSVGENQLKVAIDRPGNGRDETVRLGVRVAYRVRPDLTTLQGDHPAISIVADAAHGTSVALDGKPMQLIDGRGLEKVEVGDALTGISDETKTLSRQIPYVVTPESGSSESGVVSVSVGIVPLHIDAPGTRITTDQTSFVLAGHTLKGAEVIAAGRPIPVKPDGTFAQVMNVSSVGATQIEVRAKMPEMAPRLLPIRVRRVDNLDTAAREFVADHPLDYAGAVIGAVGKAVVLGGEVLETRRQGYQTILLLDVTKSFGCAGEKGTCTARLVQGGDSAAKKGDKIRAYGALAPPFSGAGKAVPEVNVEFLQKGLE